MRPNGFYLEIFGRRNNLHDGWVTIGNEIWVARTISHHKQLRKLQPVLDLLETWAPETVFFKLIVGRNLGSLGLLQFLNY